MPLRPIPLAGGVPWHRCSSFLVDLKNRGAVKQSSADALEKHKGIGVFSGFDPTAKSLHVGSLVPLLCLLRASYHYGWKAIALVGGATVHLGGDPSFRSRERSRLETGAIECNSQAIIEQIQRIQRSFSRLYLSQAQPGGSFSIFNNLDWFSQYSALSFFRAVAESGVKMQTLLSRQCIQSREGLTYAELSYQLFQGFDFWHLWRNFQISLQIGGSDQWGNICTGLELIPKTETGHSEAVGVCTPLLTGSDGVKLGKSEGNAVWLDASLTHPFDLYQHFLRLDDSLASALLPLLSGIPMEQVADILKRHHAAPEQRLLQHQLAESILLLVHSEDALNQAKKLSSFLFSATECSGNWQKDPKLLQLLRESGRMKDASGLLIKEVRAMTDKLVVAENLFQQGAIQLNGIKIYNVNFELPAGMHFLRLGKREPFVLNVAETK